MIENLLIYLIKSSLILAVMYVFYFLVLRRYTFFYLNRIVLLIQLVFIPIIPFLQLPSIYVPPTKYIEEVFTKQIAPSFTQNNPIPSKVDIPDQKRGFDLPSIVFIIYVLGVLFYLCRLLFNLIVLIWRYKRAVYIEVSKGYKIVWVNANSPPCSFFNWIFLPKDKYQSPKLDHIIKHESIHITQKHSWDMLIANIFTAWYWFNPFAWMYQKAIEVNLEYLTDQRVLMTGISKKEYMYNLLAIASPNWKQQLGMNYNQSSLKNRILMMNRKLSKTRSLWAYLAWMLFMPSFVFLNEPASAFPQDSSFSHEPLTIVLLITEDATESELKQLAQQVADLNIGWMFSYKDLSYHQDGKIKRVSTQAYLEGSTVASFRGYGPVKTFVPIIYGLYNDSTHFTGSLAPIYMDEILERYEEITILGAGIDIDENGLQELYLRESFKKYEAQFDEANQERLKDLENNNWQVTYYGTDEFGVISENIWNQVEQKLVQLNGKKVWYIIDDGEKLKELPEIDWKKIDKVMTERTIQDTYVAHTLTLKTREVTEVEILIKLK